MSNYRYIDGAKRQAADFVSPKGLSFYQLEALDKHDPLRVSYEEKLMDLIKGFNIDNAGYIISLDSVVAFHGNGRTRIGWISDISPKGIQVSYRTKGQTRIQKKRVKYPKEIIVVGTQGNYSEVINEH